MENISFSGMNHAKTYYPLEKILAEVPAEEYQPTKDYREYQSLDVQESLFGITGNRFCESRIPAQDLHQRERTEPDHSRKTAFGKISCNDSREPSYGRGRWCPD